MNPCVRIRSVWWYVSKTVGSQNLKKSPPSLPWKGMRGCRYKPHDSVLKLMLLLLWLCGVGTAAVTTARSCRDSICVARSSYLKSLKGVPQRCEMGRDMSSSSSSIRHLSGKVPGGNKWTHDGNFKNLCLKVFWQHKYWRKKLQDCVWIITMHLWTVIHSSFGCDLFQDQTKTAMNDPAISGNFALWQMENYLTQSTLNENKSWVTIMHSKRLMLC